MIVGKPTTISKMDYARKIVAADFHPNSNLLAAASLNCFLIYSMWINDLNIFVLFILLILWSLYLQKLAVRFNNSNIALNGYMDRLFGKELSNLLNPAPISTYSNIHKIPAKSTR